MISRKETASSIQSASPHRTLLILVVGVLMAALDIAIVGPALPAIRDSFRVDERQLSWVISLFVLFNVVGSPLLAKCSDRYGRRLIYVGSLAAFVIGSAIVAAAPDFSVMLIGRAVQAFGAGGILPVASAVIADVFPAEQRGRALGAIGAVFGIAFVLGPVLGGVLLPFGWPALFLVNIPIGIVLMFAAWRNLPAIGSQRDTPFDVRGAVLLTVTLICCALALTRIAEIWTQFGTTGKFVMAYLFAGGVCGFLLWRAEHAAADPILPPALFGSKQLRIIGMIAVATGLVEACMIFLPAVAVSRFAVSEATASFMLLPLVASLIVGSPLAGFGVDRFGVKPIIQTGLCLVVAGLLAYALLSLSKVNFYAAGACIGLGLSSLLGAPLRYATLAEVGKENRGLSQGLLSLSLSFGQIMGASAIGGLIASQMNAALGFQKAMLIVATCVALATLLSFALRPSGGRDPAT